MKKIKTKMGIIYYQDLNFYDSIDRFLWHCEDKKQVRRFIKTIKSYNSVGEWLVNERIEDVCWGSFAEILHYTRDYQVSNDRLFDRDWLVDNYNRIGDTYIMFNYSDAYK